MRKHFGTLETLPMLLIHSGARSFRGSEALLQGRKSAVARALAAVWPNIREGLASIDAVTQILGLLEDEPACNSGRGAVVQSDGLARLSASLMSGDRQKFSGVMLASHINNPSVLARALQDKEESVLGPLGCQLLARELGIPPENPVLPEAAQQWANYIRDKAIVSEKSGTVGAVVCDRNGNIAAGTSTGGNVISFPERISDSATVAGNFASRFAGISCTGAGEQIVDDGLAVKLEVRVRDGKTMIESGNAALEEALAAKRNYGWIGLDSLGNWTMYCSTEDMPCAMVSASREQPYFS